MSAGLLKVTKALSLETVLYTSVELFEYGNAECRFMEHEARVRARTAKVPRSGRCLDASEAVFGDVNMAAKIATAGAGRKTANCTNCTV